MLNEYIEQLKAIPLKNILEEIYGIELQKRGSRYYCKIRDEKTASCAIYPNNTFYDFGGGEGGDTINLVEYMENCDRRTAMEKLSQLYHIDRKNQKRNRKELMDYEWRKLGIAPDMVSKNLNINIVEHTGQWKRGTDINLNINDTEQIKSFQKKYQIPLAEFRKNDSKAYHIFLRNKVYYPLMEEKDGYLSGLHSFYKLALEVCGNFQNAFQITCSNPRYKEWAAAISDKITLLKYAVDDISLLKIPYIKLDPTHNLEEILSGKQQYQISKMSYFELCNYAYMSRENLCKIRVPYDSYAQKYAPITSELKGIPHCSIYKNDECSLYCLGKNFKETTLMFEGEVIEKHQYNRFYEQQSSSKKEQNREQKFLF